MSRIRTFIAVEVSAEVRGRADLLVNRLSRTGIKATWVKPENMHLTLKFLGDTDETLIPDVCRRVAEATKTYPAFQANFAGAGAFPSIDRPRAVWLGVTDGAQQLVDVQGSIEESLLDLRIPRERRRFKPHLTIGRIREGGTRAAELSQLLEKNKDFDAKSCEVSEVCVFASYLERSGPTYQVLARAPLAGD